MSLFIKICGLRTPEAVETCVRLGVDAIGFVFAPSSVRYIQPAEVKALMAGVPDTVEGVGVFLRVPVDEVIAQLSEAGLKTAQLHGDYEREDVAALEARGIRVIVARSVSEFLREEVPTGRVLIDGDNPGSGAEFPAELLAGRPLPANWILAGGLSPVTVARRIRELAPFGVDVSSGVESSRGEKSLALIEQFVAAARAA
jgi:phosphoribosylanthranilate isomerase